MGISDKLWRQNRCHKEESRSVASCADRYSSSASNVEVQGCRCRSSDGKSTWRRKWFREGGSAFPRTNTGSSPAGNPKWSNEKRDGDERKPSGEETPSKKQEVLFADKKALEKVKAFHLHHHCQQDNRVQLLPYYLHWDHHQRLQDQGKRLSCFKKRALWRSSGPRRCKQESQGQFGAGEDLHHVDEELSPVAEEVNEEDWGEEGNGPECLWLMARWRTWTRRRPRRLDRQSCWWSWRDETPEGSAEGVLLDVVTWLDPSIFALSPQEVELIAKLLNFARAGVGRQISLVYFGQPVKTQSSTRIQLILFSFLPRRGHSALNI